MKILIISNLYKPYQRGGAERVVEQQVARERERGSDVVLFTARPWRASGLVPRTDDPAAISNPARDPAGPAYAIYHIYPLNLYFYTNDTHHNPFMRFLWHIIDTCNIHTYFATLYLIKKERPDAIHTHNLKGIGLLIPLAIRLSRVPWTHTVHDIQLITPSGLMLVGEESHWHHTGPLTRAYRAICRLLFGSPGNVIFLSNWCRSEYDKHGFFKRSKKTVQRLTADPMFKRDEGEPRHIVRDDVVVYAGQIEPHKGIMWLLEQAAKCPQFEFHIYGDGSLLPYAKLVAAQHQHIHVHGAVSKETLAAALKQSKYFIYPSLAYENCPLAILEAQAAGCTIIAPAHSGIAELLHEHDIAIEPGKTDAPPIFSLIAKNDMLLKQMEKIPKTL